MAGSTPLSSADRRRRRRLRLIPIVGYSIVALGLAYFFEQQATTTIIFVRHADTDVAMAEGGDPPLNARGRQRAELLADFLADVDVVASVDAIYASDKRRTQETAAPLAARLNMRVDIEDHYNVGRFMHRVQRDHKGDIVLIVSHSDAIAPLIDELHGSKRLPPFGPDDFDELYIVTIPWYGKVKTLRFHYGEPPAVLESPSERASALTGSLSSEP
jgi:broad specificity phosphatase PhoE